jgi:cysteinyl-tRNA synthetase
MANALLGDELDIHCGGVDNLFPHHEAEIAQSECVTGKKFVRYWLHCAHLMVNGQKMSKKLNNFYTLRDLMEKGWTGREIRYALLTVNYRLPLNFTLDKGLPASRAALNRIDEWVQRISGAATTSSVPDNITPMPLRFNPPKQTGTGGPAPGEVPTLAPEQLRVLQGEIVKRAAERDKPAYEQGSMQETLLEKASEEFFAALDDDLNISGAMGSFFDLIHESNRALDAGTLDAVGAQALLQAWNRINHVLAVQHEVVAVPAGVLALVEKRQAARAAKDWAGSDRLRDEIAALGWVVKDTKEGPKLSAK